MKKIIIAIAAALALCTASATTAIAAQAEPVAVSEKKAKTQLKTVVFDSNFHCKKCVAKIEDNIPFEKGVKSLVVSLDKKTITVTFDPSKTSVEALKAAIQKLGYSAEPRKEE